MRKTDSYSRVYPPTPKLQKWPFHIRSIGFCHYSPGAAHPPLIATSSKHSFKMLSLYFVVKGLVRFHSASSGNLAFNQGMCLVLFPSIRHTLRMDLKSSCELEWIAFEPAFALPLLKRAGITSAHPAKVLADPARLISLYQEALTLSAAAGPDTETELSALAHQLFACALALWTTPIPNPPYTAEIERMKSSLASDPAHCQSVAEASRECNLSLASTRAHFKALTGLTPKAFQIEARLKHAERLLRETDLPVMTIAEQTGFETPYHFSNQFKLKRGLSPLAYRRAYTPSKQS